MTMSELKITSDIHLWHPLVAELRGFDTVEAHVEWFCEMWLANATKRDRIWLAGDMTVGSRERVEKTLETLDKLPGTKYAVTGNHDETHPHFKTAVNRFQRWSKTFDFVGSQGMLRLDGRYIDISHFPRLPDEHDIRERDGVMADIFGPYRIPDTGRWLLHGHTHHNDVLSGERQIHVGLDGWGRLVTMDDIRTIIREAEAGTRVPENRPGSESIVRFR